MSSKGKVVKAFAAYKSDLDNGYIQEVRMDGLQPGDFTNANELPEPREVRSVTTVTVGGKRTDAVVTFADGTTVQRYSGQVTTRLGRA